MKNRSTRDSDPSAPGSAAELAEFRRLQGRLPAIFPDPQAARTVVVLPSLSLDAEVLARIVGSHHYEERMLDGSNRSSQHPDEGGCGDDGEAALGHRRIGFIGPGDQERFPQSRLPFIQKALTSTGLRSSRDIFYDTSTSGGWTYAAQRLIGASERPTAAIVHNDDLAIRIVAHLIGLGFKVPNDISILSYDDLDISRYTQVPLTSIGYSKEELGRIAIELVLRQIEGAYIDHPVVEVPVELIVRDSTGQPPAAPNPAV